MVRGMKWFGWIFIAGTMVLMLFVTALGAQVGPPVANWLMGFFFGGLHLAYGIYLYFTEKKVSAA